MKDTRILIVDDSSTTRKIIKSSLMRLGFTRIIEAENGMQALARLKESMFDLVLTDWNMPEMDGLTFVKTLKQEPAYKDIPIIMITTESARNEVVSALKEGVTDYIVKPFTTEALMQTLDRFISKVK